MKAYLLVMMGGSGTRVGANIPKQYIEIEGRPIFSYIIEKYNTMSDIAGMVIVSHADWIGFVEEWVDKLGADKVLAVVAGGETRSNSVKNGLTELGKYAEAQDCVLLHDATHPYVDEAGTRGVIQAVAEYDGATLGEYQYDTVYEIDENDFIVKTLNRKLVVAGASPEAFKFGRLSEIYMSATQEELEAMTSAGAIAIANGIKMKVVPANMLNLKITYKNDLKAFQKTVTDYFFPEEES